MTVLETIQRSADFLSKKGVDSPRLQAELLLAHALKLPRMKLYLNFERQLSDAETNLMREFVKRRGQREPLQHITGSTSFCGIEIAVNRSVLIPRQETELLAEEGWKFLNQISEGRVTRDPNQKSGNEIGGSCNSPLRALDFGTGSGCIAIALAVKCPNAEIFAADISTEALEGAKQNAARNSAAGRVRFFQGDGFEALNGDSCNSPLREVKFDLIISNPPYIPTAEIEKLQTEVRDFDPRGALDGGADGLDFYRRIAVEAKPLLKPTGKLMLEFGDGQAEAIRKIFENEKWVVEAVREDYTRRPRILIARL